ncbi:protein-L-isoaspartate O-methyltransferase family protein [Chitinimonas sp. BJB300]|uniref:protein-L-isoaspartate O-methyltransferase family protein n=1 Tax=Chitinimonas sp. BJB300 TaxID=1559339 RepID=UPI000C0E91C2|nr:protein-L-isoaspartate O-methyltransferase [Chitinimonas sp. BJB300]PHV12536.1 protein-L-isoaspartate O-methyltransferase [Chitinimonas sp. BJB300]TSJ91115.1 protein-L-isoaspartate O-methyltransferase [Chitinimonas sp. BJB300]
MDWEQARFNMVEQQIRPWEVLDMTVLALLSEVKRENFVPAARRDMALVDMEIPLIAGAKMWHPKLEARAVQEVALTGTERVLEIGTGSGYLAALMSKLAKQVYSVEIDAALADQARSNLAAAGIQNVTVEVGDAAKGWSKYAPYDVIVATGSYPTIPAFLYEQLAEGGRLFAVVGDEPAMTASVFTKVAGSIKQEKLFETVITPLVNAPQPARFEF